MCRHPRLRLRKPQILQQQDETGFAKAYVGIFFDIFETVLLLLMMMINFSPHCLSNYDETDLIVFQNKVHKVSSLKVK
jgi:hypothetical protein